MIAACIYTFLATLETFLLYWMGASQFDLNPKNPFLLRLSFAVYFLFQLISYIIQAPLFSTIIFYILFSSIVIFIAFTGPLSKKLLVVQLFVITNYACKLLSTLIQFYFMTDRALPHIPFSIVQTPVSQTIASILTILLITLYSLFQKMRRQKQATLYTSIKYILPSMIIFICIQLFSVTLNLTYFYLYIAIILYAISVIVFYLIDASDIVDEEANQAMIATKMLAMQKEYYKSIEDSQKDMIALRHDFKNHLQSLSFLLQSKQYEEAAQYIEVIYEEANKSKIPVSGGNNMINILLNNCQVRAEASGISLSTNIMIPNALPITNTDISIVLGNLIDNAIEACEKLPPNASIPRFIKIDIRILKQFLFIKIVNAFNGEYIKDGLLFKTLKPEKHHGIGLSNIQRVVEKYNGTIKYTPIDHEFTSTIMFPLP